MVITCQETGCCNVNGVNYRLLSRPRSSCSDGTSREFPESSEFEPSFAVGNRLLPLRSSRALALAQPSGEPL